MAGRELVNSNGVAIIAILVLMWSGCFWGIWVNDLKDEITVLREKDHPSTWMELADAVTDEPG